MDKITKGQKDTRQFYIVMSGQFCTVAMFLGFFILSISKIAVLVTYRRGRVGRSTVNEILKQKFKKNMFSMQSSMLHVNFIAENNLHIF